MGNRLTNFAARIRRMMPDTATVSLLSRTSGDTFAAGVNWRAQRLPRTQRSESSELLEADAMRQTWRLFKESQSTSPAVGDKMTDAASVTWQIIEVWHRMGQNIFDCVCIRNI
jgi:hypothetical protein